MTVNVVMPSRGRPDRAALAIQAIRDTAELDTTRVVLVVDADDPDRAGYDRIPFDQRLLTVTLSGADTGNLVRATNTVSMTIAKNDPDCIIANFGDDHVARTAGFDRIVTYALSTPGIAYGRDGIHDEHMPTAPFISAVIPLALGWYALPSCRHLYIDNVWRDLAEQAGVRRYLPEVLIEHMHPAVGKATWDDGYVRANNADAVNDDHRAYERWRVRQMAHDVRRVRGAVR